MTGLRAALCAAFFMCHAGIAPAQDVTLSSRDGSVTIRGMLLGFDGAYYRVETEFGELTLDSSGVTCDGPGCPGLGPFVAEFAISGAAVGAEVLIPALLRAFADQAGYGFATAMDGEGRTVISLSDPVTATDLGRFTIRASNSDEGFADLLANEADLVVALREIHPGELHRAIEAGMGNLRATGRFRVVALDALVPVVAPGNPVQSITLPDLARVFSGEIDNWAALGGPDAPIVPHLRDARSGLGQLVEERLLAPVGAVLSPAALRHDSDQDLTETVLSDPFAIGMTAVSAADGTVQLGLSGACGFTIAATRRNAKTEDYPLTAPVFLYLPARRMPQLARDFLAFTRQPAAQLAIRDAGFIDQLPEQITPEDQGARFANAILQAGPEVTLDDLQRMTRTLTPMNRLSLTFRFDAGSALLDAQSRSNVEQLAAGIEAGAYDGHRLVFVGFSDGQGDAGGNRRIAMERAESVRRAVMTQARSADLTRIDMATEAFGEAMPMACDDSAWGRHANRRVEVWLR
ncbi:OmpA family protein [Primorskyibacter flagellatus]|uniref:OmpA family protein n=1 Tax=Primorskyibacter flagellatus TaxID=1387277 RepID=A0A917AEW8_9RHOB|nr:phosphate ABC transporter substrate-binding/OmpA family protein [Primorskyibacter flagellatus]GGE45889.1 OmpA family protein [Primorskyibacter flagellatus]